jgi:inner membrane protein
VSALAVLTHPALDWLNTYGMRWLMPFDGTWFYGDALFIIDPWIWLTLGGVLYVSYSNRRLSQVRWAVFWALTSLLVLADPVRVPWPAKALWVVALATIVAIRWRRDKIVTSDAALDRAAAAALAIVAVYIGAMVGASAAARAQVRAGLAARGITGVERVMVAPVPTNPFAGEVVAATADAYYMGRWQWLAEPRLELASESLPRPRGEVFEAAARTRDAQRYLSWARFPTVDVEEAGGAGTANGYVVRFSDARYRDGERLFGPTVRLDRNLQLE